MGKQRKIGEGNERPNPVDAVFELVDFLELYNPPKYDPHTSNTQSGTPRYRSKAPDTELFESPVAQALASQSDPALRVFRDVFYATDEYIRDITDIIAKDPELQKKVRDFHIRTGYRGNPDYLNLPKDS